MKGQVEGRCANQGSQPRDWFFARPLFVVEVLKQLWEQAKEKIMTQLKGVTGTIERSPLRTQVNGEITQGLVTLEIGDT